MADTLQEVRKCLPTTVVMAVNRIWTLQLCRRCSSDGLGSLTAAQPSMSALSRIHDITSLNQTWTRSLVLEPAI